MKTQGANFRDLEGVRVRSDNKVEWDPDIKRVYLPSGKPLVCYVYYCLQNFLFWTSLSLTGIFYNIARFLTMQCHLWEEPLLSKKSFNLSSFVVGRGWLYTYFIFYRNFENVPRPFGRLWWDETVPTVVTRAEPHNQVYFYILMFGLLRLCTFVWLTNWYFC